MAKPQHHWTKPEDIVAFFLSRWGDRSFLGIGTATIVRVLNERPASDGNRTVPITSGSLSVRAHTAVERGTWGQRLSCQLGSRTGCRERRQLLESCGIARREEVSKWLQRTPTNGG